MDVQNNRKEEIKNPEKKISADEQAVNFRQEAEPIKEIRENSQDEKLIAQGLKREIELMEADELLKKQAEEKANKMQFLADDDKIKNLLQIAKEKGVVFAIKVAKSMNEPFLLDTFHDILAKEGYYKNFVKE